MCAYDPTETYRKLSFRNIPHRVRLRQIEKTLKAGLKGRQVKNMMDIGCASGFITHRLKELLNIEEVSGTDALDEYISQARKDYPDISFRLMDLNKENTLPEKFDLLTCFETLEHVGNLQIALNNIISCMAINGLTLISVPIEVGLIGIIKYLLKVKIYKDSFNEIGAEHKKKYFKSLIRGEDISQYRTGKRELWWDHFGFNYQQIEKYLTLRQVKFKAFTSFTTRFIFIYK